MIEVEARTRLIALFLIVAVIFTPLAITTSAQNTPKQPQAIATWFLAPAIDSSQKKASLINITILITYPGTGHITVKAGGTVASTTRTSTMLAIYTAAIAANVDWRNYNYTVTFHIDMPIEGPSASFGIALATYLLLKDGIQGLPYVVTGAISPDLTDLPVGGVAEKAEAAVEEGYTFFFPLANINTIPAENMTNETVPVTGLYNVSTFLGYDIPVTYTFNTTNILPPQYAARLRMDTDKMLAQARGNLTQAERILGADDPRIEAINNFIQDVIESIQHGIHPYTAASLAFTALFNSTRLYYLALIENGTLNIEQEVLSLRQRISELAEEMNQSFETVYSFELLSIAQARLADANLTLEKLMNNTENADPEIIAQSLGYASARIETVRHWYLSALELNETPPYLPSPEMVQYAVSAYLEYTKEATEYILAILQETVGNSDIGKQMMQTYTRILEMINVAEKELSAGRYAIALGLAHRALSDIVAMFAGITSEVASGVQYRNLMEEYLAYQIDTANRFILDIISAGYPSIIAIDYYEYALAKREAGVDPIVPMEFLSQSIASAIFWKILAASKTTLSRNVTLETQTGTHGTTPTNMPELRDLVILILLTPAWIFLGYLIAVSKIRRRIELEEV
ncbi:MAG: hypothetical protein F7C32_00095 [Desulfurococcales archaeon]|nr:hypothetical protein [Desulfurococcales archaeon]